ncbi:MAG: phospholipase D family protein [Deltaproteobacteria bacterium]|nr:phospholipase D family protein [Deltaproteobacteria bacterium]
MDVSTVTAPSGGLLAAVRATLAGADDALLCVAFAQTRGVHLIGEELAAVSDRSGARVLVTTVFSRAPTPALTALSDTGASVRVLNPGGGTYHPKVFLGRRGNTLQAVVGSANLTSGLAANIEAATYLRGSRDDEALARLWTWAESAWSDPRARDWVSSPDDQSEEEIEPELLALIDAAITREPELYTLGPTPKLNVVRDRGPSGLWVETERTRAANAAAQLVPPRMLNLAWDVLRSRGELSNRTLLDELRVHRSSFVCALLARVPGVEVVSSRPIVLRYAASE